jgi:type II secretory pathway component PulF
MPTFKYQAVLPTGVSIFGVFDAEDQNVLQSYLQSRSMTLVNATELSISSVLSGQNQELPRMLQLRIGDRLREALLTDMPAHVAVRAIAAEPIEHPVLMSMPWLMVSSVFASVVMMLLSILIPDSRLGLVISAGLLPMLVVQLWVAAWFWFVYRPRRMLLRIADQLERGQHGSFTGLGLLPGELSTIMNSQLSSQTKATAVAELVPTLSGMRLKSHHFAAMFLSPLIALTLLMIGMHVMLISIVVQFKEIFLGFGVELPVITMLFINLSDIASSLGLPGLFASATFMIAALVLLHILLVLPKTAELWESVPGLGLSVRWLMQARVARILGVLVRNRVGPADAITIAAKASGFSSVAESGKRIAEVIESGTPELAYTRQLSGLPLSLLFRVSGSKNSEAARQETAQAFQSYASALEQAASGNGSFIAVLFQMLIVVSAGLLVGFMVISLFLPLIQLLNALSMIVWWLP